MITCRPLFMNIVTILALLLFISPLPAQHYLYKQVTSNTGLPTTLSCIYADSKGFIWTGTSFGLGRFDGHEQKRYIHQPQDSTSLPGNQIYQILEDNQQTLWILTDRGVTHYNYRSNAFSALKNETGRPVLAYSICKWQEKLLLGGANTIYIYDSKKRELEKIYKLDGVGDFKISKMCLVNTNLLLCGSRWNGIQAINLQTGNIIISPFDCGKEISDLFVDSQHRIWIAPYNQGVHCFKSNGEKISSYTTHNSQLTNDIVLSIAERKGEIWMGTDGGGINILNADGKKFTHLQHLAGEKLYSLPTNSINCLYNDTYNNIWIGGVYNGLINIREVSMKTYTDISQSNERRLSHSIVLCIYQENTERIWVGTDGGGINCFNPQTERFTHYPSTSEDKITSICEFTPGKLLIAAFSEGLFIFDKATGTKSPFIVIDEETTNILSKHSYSVYLHRNTPHTILLLSNHVYIYDLRTKKFAIATEEKKGLINWGTLQAITSIENATYLFDSKHIYVLDHTTQVLKVIFACNSEMSINSVTYDNQGSFWIGTTQGLSQYIPDKGKLIPIKTNLFSGVSLVVCEPQKEEIWIGAENMLFSYSPSKNNFILFGESDGAMPNEYIPRSQLVIPNKGIYMGGVKGLLYISNQRQTYALNRPELQISDIILNGESVNSQINQKQEVLAVPRNSNIIIMLMAKEEDIFRKKLYRYRIEGLDNRYTESYNPELAIRALQPGNYRIFVSCTTKDGNWIPDQQILALTILPPWYRSSWFIAICIILFPLLIIGSVQRTIKRKEEKLKWAMQKHEQKMYEDKVRFLINISHELRTPLTLIYAPLKRMLQQLPPDTPSYLQLKAIFRQSQRMKDLINMVLDLRKMEVGGIQLHFEPQDFNQWIKDVSQDFVTESQEHQISIEYKLDPTITDVYFDKAKCEIVLTNLLINAMKHSPVHTTITISSQLLTTKDTVKVSITDQGSGLKQVDANKLFTRFYQGADERSGTGIGLSYSKILIEQHQGNIGVQNNEGNGTTFFFELPVHQENETIACAPNAYLNKLMEENQSDINIQADTEKFDTKIYTILVADDNSDLTDFIKDTLKEHFKKVITASDGSQALQLINSYKPDIVISDVMMPRMNGYELCNKIKENSDTSHIPVILLTAKDDKQSMISGYKNGADAYLPKPFEIEMLVEVIVNRLKNRESFRRKYAGKGVTTSTEEMAISETNEAFLLKIDELIQKNIANTNLDTNLICQEMGMSRASLFNKLKALTNMGSNEYITKKRMERAIQLVKSTNLSITEISEQVGFATSSYFSTAFKQYTGETPSKYKKRIKEESA